LILISGLVVALAVPAIIRNIPMTPKIREIRLVAKRYGYTPGRIVVNRGDKVVIKPTSQDVTHGFYLDGYPVEFIIKQQGVAFQKYTWKDENGKTRCLKSNLQRIDPGNSYSAVPRPAATFIRL